MGKRSVENVLEIIRKDFRDARSNPIVIITLIGIIILPSLYAIINIDACWDPYERTGEMDFAIANNDRGATYQNLSINVGNDLVDDLQNDTRFHWVFVSEDELRQGVRNGTYYAGIVIPENLSENVISITTDDPHSAQLIYIVNDKTNPVAPRIAQQGANTIYREMNAKIVEFINLAAYGRLGELQSELASGSSQLSSGATQLSGGAAQVSSGAAQVESGAGQVSSGAAQINDGATELSQGAQQVSDGWGQVEDTAQRIRDDINISQEDIDNLPQGPVKDTVNTLIGYANTTGQLVQGSDNVAQGSIRLASSSSQLADGSVQLAEGSLSLAAGAKLLSNSAVYALMTASSSLSGAADSLSNITGINETVLGQYFYAPVTLETEHLFEVENYGSQVAPFYIVLSMWVGALITCTMLRPGTSTGTKYTPVEMYFGKLALFIVLSILQASVTMILAYVIGVNIDNLLMFIFTSWFVSAVFMTLIYSFVSAVGQIGKVVAILLLVFQISATGGIYPIDIMGSLYQTLYPFMPMTYGINIMRESMLGLLWSNYIPSFTILIGIGIATIAVSLIVKTKLDKASHYFEDKLKETDLF